MLEDVEAPRIFGEWERTGHCSRCGECCKGNPFTGIPEGYCPLFAVQWDPEREGWRGCCTDRTHEYYQKACAPWPSHPDQIADKPHCTYQFRRVADGG